MKKVILFVLCLFAGLFAEAQIANGVTAFSTDTAVTRTVNKEARYLAPVAAVPITGNYTVALFVVPLNVSGTQTVKALPQASYDGAIWFDIALAADSVPINTAGAVKKYGWTYANAQYRYYRILVNGYNTGITTYTGGIILKRQN